MEDRGQKARDSEPANLCDLGVPFAKAQGRPWREAELSAMPLAWGVDRVTVRGCGVGNQCMMVCLTIDCLGIVRLIHRSIFIPHGLDLPSVV
jgi:hypothetical protein